jgi:DNA-directed RNA polymerase subunit RPC12/RpoP
MQFQQRCEDCKATWNAAFGIVGTTYIAQPPTECPHCKSKNIVHHADGWKMNLPHPTEKE